VWFLQLTSRAE